MPYTTINSGDYITAAWANTDVRDQVVVPYSSTTDRSNNGPATPVAGMVSTLTTNTATEGLYEYTSAGTWRAPWNMPWGNVAISALPASFTFNSTLAYSATFTWSAINRRRYMITFGGEWQNGAVTGVYDTCGVYDNAATPAAQSLVVIRNTPPQANAQISNFASFNYTSAATGTVTWKLGAISSASATNQTFVPYSIIIQDIGPSGAPS